jgi:hypothetical protein
MFSLSPANESPLVSYHSIPTCFLLLENSLFTPDWQSARDAFSTPHPPHSKTDVSAFHWLFTPKVSGQLSYDLLFSYWRNFARKAKFEIQNRVFVLFLFPPHIVDVAQVASIFKFILPYLAILRI